VTTDTPERRVLVLAHTGRAEVREVARACVGALFGPDDPTYLYYGPDLTRRIAYLRAPDEEQQADDRRLTTILVKTDDYQDAQARLRAAGWKLDPQSLAVTVATRSGGASVASCS